MKTRRITILITLLTLLLTVGCVKKDPHTKLKESFNKAELLILKENTSANAIITDFEVVDKFEDYQITWTSDKPENITIDGNKVSVTLGNEIILVKLTATIKIEEEIITRTIEITILNNGGNGVESRKGTFNRSFPAYYEKGVPLIDDAHIIYINWDGFGHYYLEEFFESEAGKNSTLFKLKEEGVYFKDLRNTFPSLTNPVQNQILSGGTSLITKNIYRYYNKETDTVIQQARENNALILPQVTVEAGLSTASVAMYLAEPYLTSTDINKLYIPADTSNPKVVARGESKSTDHFSRMEQAIKMIKGEEVMVGGKGFVFDEMPRFTLIYADDIDGVGHNEKSTYGYPFSNSEQGRIDNVVNSLAGLDEKIGELVQLYKDKGLYEKTVFVITTDHGMSPFGSPSSIVVGKYSESKINDLKTKIESINPSYQFEYLDPGQSPSADTNIVAVGQNLQLALTFLNGSPSAAEYNLIKQALMAEEYVGLVRSKDELIIEDKVWAGANIDILVVPSEQYHFSTSAGVLGHFLVQATHDTYLETSRHIYGIVFGGPVKQGVITTKVENVSLGHVIADTLEINLGPTATAPKINFLKED